MLSIFLPFEITIKQTADLNLIINLKKKNSCGVVWDSCSPHLYLKNDNVFTYESK
jgi:hypothetical protein